MCNNKSNEFLFNFIVKYNEQDVKKNGSSKEFWKEMGLAGEFLYYIRNIIVHELRTRELLLKIDKKIGYKKILNIFDNIENPLDNKLKISCIDFLADYYEKYFISRDYKRCMNGEYSYFYKSTEIEGVNKNVFIYSNTENKEGFMTRGVHSYNHELGENDDVEVGKLKLHIRSEPNGYILINNYGYHKDSPIGLEIRSIDNNDRYKFIIPKLKIYNDIKDEIRVGYSKIDIICNDAKEYDIYLNRIYKKESKYIRCIIKQIKKSMKELEKDMLDINLL